MCKFFKHSQLQCDFKLFWQAWSRREYRLKNRTETEKVTKKQLISHISPGAKTKKDNNESFLLLKDIYESNSTGWT